jgi:hypothetical protein
MKRSAFVLSVLVLLAGLPLLSGHSEEPRKVGDLMQLKLKYAQKVLEGVAVKDFEKIARNAEDLIVLSNEIEWRVLKTPQYQSFSDDFRRNARNLIKHAKDENLDACALDYVDLTLTCVKCHKHVREVRMTALPRPPSGGGE